MILRFQRQDRTETGFTLIELLVVIAIIAVITAIAVPAFINQRKKAKDASVLADVKNLANVVQTALIDCPAADVFQFSIGADTKLPLEVKQADGTVAGPFESWHTLSSETLAASADNLNVKLYTYSVSSLNSCFAKGISLSDGNYLHLTEVVGFENNRFLIYGWNPNGGKYNGDTVNITGDNGQLPEAAKDSVVIYDSMTGGIVNK